VSLTAPTGTMADLVEVWQSEPVLESSTPFQGLIFDVRRDRVDLGEGGVVTRDFVTHPGAVAVLALHELDGVEHVLMIRQYRHATGAHVWELPAGLLDVDGEAPHVSAARELHEEADLVAGEWHLLLDHYTSPGGSTEALRVFLARDLRAVPDHEQHPREGEELGMPVRRVPLDDLVEAVLAGDVHNVTLMVSVLAASRLRERGWAGLRPPETPWPTRPPGRR
jgi:8-oxo-dGDP phosphatase